ncbi:hypothetical protein [Plantactinospora sonchi]|uniref:DUF4386 family protein n=1 Tax=Plantactinospora sonchi TaxID=1544735 RepID=A0ABU7RRQ1_9ACTN
MTIVTPVGQASRSTTLTRTRLGALAFVAAGVLFVLYPAVRPWHDESTVDGAVASMGSGAWVAAHLFGMLGFVLVPLGLLALWGAVRSTRAESHGLGAVVTGWIGAGLTLPYYGAEDFGLHAIARSRADGQRFDLLAVVESVRFSPVAATTFALGLLLLAVAAVLAALAVRRSGTLARHSAIPFAVGFALFIPQFYAPAGLRIAHGVLVGIGSAWLAWVLWRTDPR